MLKYALPAVLLLSVSIANASDTAAPDVGAMNCDQMRGELTAAGLKMKSQLDPAFASEAQAMASEAQGGPSGGAVAQGIGMSVACSIPGIGMFCMAAQQAMAMSQGAQAEENMARLQAQMERMEKAMEGIDMDRMQLLTQRFDEKKCEVPQ